MKRSVLALLSVAFLVGALCAGAAGRTTLEVKDGKIIVTMYIAFQGGTDELVNRWVQEIRDVWNGPSGRQEYPRCKHQVVFVVNTMNVPKGQPFPRGWHRVEVKEYDGKETSLPRAGGQYTIAYMGKTTRSPSVAGASIDGVWSTRASAPVDTRKPPGERFKDASHEAGHMMGLPDFYDRKINWGAEHLMGQTSGPHAKVTAELIALLVEAISGKYYCPICPAPSTLPPLAAVKMDGLVQGLKYDCYEGKFPRLPDFTKLRPVKTGTAAGLDLGVASREEHFALVFTGYVEVPADGCYTFHLRSDDGSRLEIGTRVVADNDGSHGPMTKRGDMTLKAGKHPFRLAYFNLEKTRMLELRYSGPSLGKTAVPNAAFFRKP